MVMSTFQRIRKALEEKKKAQQVNIGMQQSETIETSNFDTQQQEIAEMPDFDNMNVKDLKSYAQNSGINIDGLTKKDDIKSKVSEFINEKSSDFGNEPEKEGA